MTRIRRVPLTAAIGAVLLVGGCQPGVPPEALQLSRESLERRQLQTRRFDTANEAMLLQASAGVLQDLGFNLDESETQVGVIVGSKDRDATEAGQVIAAIAVAALLGAHVPFDERQKIRASLVTRPIDGGGTAVRVTFQRIVWNTDGKVSKAEFIDDAVIYREFFDKLGQSIFLTANQI